MFVPSSCGSKSTDKSKLKGPHFFPLSINSYECCSSFFINTLVFFVFGLLFIHICFLFVQEIFFLICLALATLFFLNCLSLLWHLLLLKLMFVLYCCFKFIVCHLNYNHFWYQCVFFVIVLYGQQIHKFGNDELELFVDQFSSGLHERYKTNTRFYQKKSKMIKKKSVSM